MSTLTSTFPNSATIPSSQSSKKEVLKGLSGSFKSVRTSAITHLTGSLHQVLSEKPEKFYQDHIAGIYMAIFFETAMGPLFGAIGIYMYISG
jgi:hypothetical protein